MAKKDLTKKSEAKPPARSTLGEFLALRPKRHSHAVRRSHHHRTSGPAADAGADAIGRPSHRLRLVDLDHARSDFDVHVASTILVAKLEDTIRQRSRRHPLGPDDAVYIYRVGGNDQGDYGIEDAHASPHRLQPGDVVGHVCSIAHTTTLYYRVFSADADARHGHHYHHWHDRRLRFRVEVGSSSGSKHHREHRDRDRDRDRDRQHRPSTDALRQLAHDILDADGRLSVADVRARLAAALDVRDARRISLLAHGGLRPGQPLAGEAWLVGRLLAAWLCQCLVVHVHAPRRFLVVRGGGGVVRNGSDGFCRRRTYLLHEPWEAVVAAAAATAAGGRRPSSTVGVATVQQWVRERLLKGVHEQASGGLHCRSRHVQLLGPFGGVLDGHARIAWGCSGGVEFRLRDDMVEAFADDETWLLPATETCMICLEERAVTELPHRVTAACGRHADAAQRHLPTLCKACLAAWIASSLGSGVWNRLRCPECPAPLSFADVRLFAEPAVFARYDTLATRAALESEFPGFRWCLAEKCTSGQIHGPSSGDAEQTCPKFRCHACHATHCIRHNMPWHAGETCEQYDSRTQQRQQDNQMSEAFVKQTSKPCPKCHKAVFKYTGCNHISCVCGHQWCYICFAPFVHSDYGILRCQHRPGCSERDLFEELGLNRRPIFPPRRPVRRD